VVDVVLWHERMGQSPAQIVAEHPGQTLADVRAAPAYYHDHKGEIDADLRADEEAFERLKRQQPSLLEKVAAKRPDVRTLSPTAALAYLRSGDARRKTSSCCAGSGSANPGPGRVPLTHYGEIPWQPLTPAASQGLHLARQKVSSCAFCSGSLPLGKLE